MVHLAKILLFLIVSSFSVTAFSQIFDSPQRVGEYDNTIDPDQFDDKLLGDAVLYLLNYELRKQAYQELKPFEAIYPMAKEKADAFKKAGTSSELSSKYEIVSMFESNGYAPVGCDELLLKMSARSGKEYTTYYKLAEDVVLKWLNYKKSIKVLKSGTNVFAGVGTALDGNGKAFIVVAIANYKTLNKGAAGIKESGFPVSTSTQGLKPYDERLCRSVTRYPNLSRHANDITVADDGTIYFETHEFKQFKKLLRESGDGLVADVVIKKQYTICGRENIVDYAGVSKGVMCKKLLQSKLLKINEFEGKEARKKMKVALGKVPEGYNEYEVNLLIVKDKHVCASLTPFVVSNVDTDYSYSINILADTVTAFGRVNYTPVPDTFDLQFKIPFAAGASVYKDRDVKPLLDSLGKSYLVIQKAKITACSSIEGDDAKNEQLREARAKSIKDIFVKNKISSSRVQIATKDSWDEFYKDLKTSKYKYLARMEKDKLKDYIAKRRLEAKLEPILSKHRYAQLDMSVYNDISGDKEQYFLVQRFNRLADNTDTVEALKMQKYIIQNLLDGTYDKSIVSKMVVPQNSRTFAGMRMNKLWLEYRLENKQVDSYFARVVDTLYSIAPDNEYIAFNKIFCDLKFVPVETEQQVQIAQEQIEKLYTSSITRNTLDPLNLEFQLKALAAVDSIGATDVDAYTNTILERIKTIFDVQQDDWKGAMNLSGLFVKQKDYEFAAKVLEPFVSNNDVNEELLFQYVSICSALPQKVNSDKFAYAVELAAELDAGRLCGLFYDKKMSVQFLENPDAKKVYCSNCSR